MNPETQKSILQMARGAIMERADYEMSRVLANILDANTSPTAKRKLTLTLELKPDDSRETITVSCTAKSTLAPTSPVVTSLYVADGEKRGGNDTTDSGSVRNRRRDPRSPAITEAYQICVRRKPNHVERVH